MNVMDLVAKISLDSQDYEKEVGNAKSSFAGLGTSIASGAKTIAKVGVGAFTAIGTAIGGATTALISNAKETAEYADNIDKLSQKMGFTTDAFQEWDFIMQHNGSSIDSVKGALIKLDKALDSNSEAFAELGLSAEEMQNMTSEEKWEASIKALQGVTDETKKAELAQELFGKSYQEFMPLLNQTAEETEAMKQQVHDLGGVMSEDAVKAGAQFKDSLQNLKTALTGAKNNLMGEFLPSLSTVMDGLSKLFSGDDSGIGQIKQGIEDFASKLSEKLPKVLETIGGIAESLISALPSFFNAIAQQLPSLINTLIPVLINALVGLADAITNALPDIISAIEQNIDVITQGLTKVILAIGQIIIKLIPKLLPMMIKVGLQLIKALAKGFIDNASEIIKAIFETINVMVKELTNPDTLMQLLECGLQILMAIVQGIIENLPILMEAMFTLIGNVLTFLVESIPEVLSKALELFCAIGQGALDAIETILGDLGSVLTDILTAIGGWATDVLGSALDVFLNIGQGLKDAFNAVGDGIWAVIGTVGGWIKDRFYEALDWIKDVGEWLGKKLGEAFNIAKKYIVGPLKSLGDYIGSTLYDIFHDDEPEPISDETWNLMSESYVGGVSSWEKKGEKDGNSYVSGVQKSLDVHSPSKRMRWLGQMTMEGFSEGLEDEADDALDVLTDTVSDVPDIVIDKRITKAGGTGTSDSDRISRLETLIEQMAKRKEVIMVNVGGRQMEEIIIDAKQNVTTRSGGQVYV